MIKFVVLCEDYFGGTRTLGPFDNVADAQAQPFGPNCREHSIIVKSEKEVKNASSLFRTHG